MAYTLNDPAVMTPSQRRREIAAILARGILRLRQCGETSADSPEPATSEKLSESGRNRLEPVAKLRPCVSVG